MILKLLKSYRVLILCLAAISLTACNIDEMSKPKKKTELVLPTYMPPNHMVAKKAYIEGFKLRYDIPELDYPDDIKQRVRFARIEILRRNEKYLKMNMGLVRAGLNSEYIATLRGQDKTIAEQILDDIDKKDFDAILDASVHNDRMWKMMTAVATTKKNKGKPRPPFTARDYDKAVRIYPSRIKSLKISECNWEHMIEYIGSGYDEMGVVHDERPPSAYKCDIETHIKSNARYNRPFDTKGYFFKSEKTGKWLYYGKFPSVRAKPRRLSLNPKILKNPEKAIRKLPFWEVDI